MKMTGESKYQNLEFGAICDRTKDLAQQLNPIIRGWIQYYGKFNRSELYKVLKYLDMKLLGWVKRKYKKHGSYTKRPKDWLGKVSSILPNLFAHWRFVKFSG
jgi:RNA-directed DNA polymerase